MSTPTVSWPTLTMPGTGSFTSSIPSTAATTYNGTGYLDKLKDGLASITSSQSPEVIQGVLAYIINLENDPATASATTAFLNQNVDMNSLIQTATLQGMESAFFMGYNGQTGEQAASAYLHDMSAALQSSVTAEGKNSYAEMMTQALNGLSAMLPQFTSDHTDNSGNMIWTYGGMTYTWNSHPTDSSGNAISIADSITDPTQDNFYIANLITGLNSGGTENSLYSDLANNFNSMEANWRVTSLNQMIADFKAKGLDVIDAIMMWLTVAYDNQYQSQESALANTTNSETLQTNSYATTLTKDVQSFGSMDNTQAESFVNTLLNWNTYVSSNPNSSSIASSLESNTIEPVLNAQITSSDTLGSYLTKISNGTSGYSWSGLASALNALVPANPSAPTVSGGTETGGSTTASTSPAYLAITNAIQAGGDLVTQTSKQTSTDLTEITNLDNALLQLGNSAVNPQGSGPLAFQQAIVNNQRVVG